MESFLEDIFSGLCYTTKTRGYLKKRILEFRKYPLDDLFIHVCQKYTDREIMSILLNLPELWMETDIFFWQNLILKNSPRVQDQRVSYFDNSKYDDIKFLIGYIGVNPLEWYFSNENISMSDKINMLVHCKKFIAFILPPKKYGIYKLGYININKERYAHYCLTFRTKILNDGGFDEGFAIIEDLENYLNVKYIEMINHTHSLENLELLKKYESMLVVRPIEIIKLEYPPILPSLSN